MWAVLVVYLSIAAIVFGAVGLAGVAAVDQVTSASDAITKEFEKQPGEQESSAERRVDRFQDWLDARGPRAACTSRTSATARREHPETGVDEYAKRAVDIGQQVAADIDGALGVLVDALFLHFLDEPVADALDVHRSSPRASSQSWSGRRGARPRILLAGLLLELLGDRVARRRHLVDGRDAGQPDAPTTMAAIER